MKMTSIDIGINIGIGDTSPLDIRYISNLLVLPTLEEISDVLKYFDVSAFISFQTP